jgi:F-type H+-transporting ATPase subunit gamma
LIRQKSFTTNSSKRRERTDPGGDRTHFVGSSRSAIAYTTARQKVLSNDAIARSKSIQAYDSTDADVLRSFQEFNLASVLFYTMKENATSEQSSRMTAMDNATKNAGELINKLTTYYNRTRQAVITTELIEIISGAAALEQKQ